MARHGLWAGLLLFATSALAEQPLRLCALEHDAPRSERETKEGIDLDLAAALAGELGVAAETVWVRNSRRILEIEDSDLPLGRLVRGACDIVASVPGEESLAHFASRVTLSAPYYGLAFELVGDADLPNLIEGLGETRTAVQLQTFAHLALQQLGVPWHAATSTAAALEVLDRGNVAAALVWGPDLGPLKRRPRGDFLPSQGLRWNAHLAMRRDDPRTGAIERALGALRSRGAIRSQLEAHGVPYREPFASVSSAGARRALRTRP
ncbi:MAG: hypothetical protein HKP27_10205 [Myxococcales bacterium]|nr:hypothetical protein [Myxococcales bacterium]